MTHQAVLFPGQGAQFVGMAAQLADRCPATGELFEAASRLLGQDLYRVCAEGPEELLNSTALSQPAIFVVSLAVLRTLESQGAAPAAMGTAGLSLGEYSALVYAGVLDFSAALEIVVRRGEYMQEACDRTPSGMTSILGLDLAAVRALVEEARDAGVVAVANVNAHNQVVISGELGALERASALALERGARKAVPLKVAGAYHSPLMASATERLRPYLERATFRAPRLPFYPNVTAQRTRDPAELRAGLIRQIESPVLWAPTLDALIAAGMRSVLEPGPGRVVAGLVKQVDRTLPVHSVLDEESLLAYRATVTTG